MSSASSRKAPRWCSPGLLVTFMGAGFLALVRGLNISCGCFFPFMGGEHLNWSLFLRDGLLLLLALQVLAWPSTFLRPFAVKSPARARTADRARGQRLRLRAGLPPPTGRPHSPFVRLALGQVYSQRSHTLRTIPS